ncbi:VWA domain-containing protein [Sphingomonas sp. KR3-1]|uniref:vWA domain-containing protein n=1 Tax=Sphingomonas sp. KR3-1 TaxID=3156611 RepID=UPI0032B4B30A
MDTIYDQDDSVPQVSNIAVNNTEQRTPCVLLIDCSASMQGRPMQQVNAGFRDFERAIKDDPFTASRVLVSVIAFGGDSARIVMDWTEAEDFVAPTFDASGLTPMGGAVEMGLDEIDRVKQSLRLNGITCTRPWMFILTDGEPTDAGWEAAADRCATAAANKKVVVWALTTEPGQAGKLSRFVGPGMGVFDIEGADLQSMFVWLSSSLSAASEPGAGATRNIPAPGQMIAVEV